MRPRQKVYGKKLILSLVIFLFVALFIYARWVEPNWIEVSRHSVEAKIAKPMRIAHISDLHIRSLSYRETKILAILELEKPDVILVTGDSIAENANHQAVDTFLRKLQAPLGVWAVNGNWEHWRPKGHAGSPSATLLNNSAIELTKGVWVVGIDDESSGTPDIQKALINVPENSFKIGLFHSPSLFDQAHSSFSLVLAGHTHGGQIRLPFVPPLWLPEGSGRFISGWYSRDKAKMYVSRGLGNSILDIRFFCRPELSIIEIEPLKRQ